MAEKITEPSNGHAPAGATLDQLSAIRTILMGEQIQSTEAQFQAINDRINALTVLLKETEASLAKRLETAQKDLSTDLTAKNAALEAALKAQGEKFAQKTDADKKEIGKLFMEIGKKLMD